MSINYRNRPIQIGTSLPVFVALFITGCIVADKSPQGSPEELAIEEVRKVLQEIIAADNAGDVEAIEQLYSVDAILIPPGGAIVTGRQDIGERYREGFRQFKLEVNFTSDETSISGDLAYDRGITTGRRVWLDGRDPTPLNDKYLMILRRQSDGAWKIARLMWNQNE